MSVINSQPLIGASGNQSTAYNLTRSLRFRSSASAYLNRTPASAGNRQKWTWSGWVKKGALGSSQSMLDAYTAGSTYGILQFLSTDIVQWYDVSGGSATMHLETTQVFRDPSAWYHLVFAYDSTQATSSNRAKLYVNGVQITSFSTTSYPAQNTNSNINNNIAHDIGRFGGGSNYLDGYLTEVNFVDGQQLTPSDFGETDTATGVWKPKKYTGTYGTNGFYLKFDNLTSTSTLGNDSSGNSNTWTVNNISLTSGATYDSMKDVPTLTDADTANYCVLNPLQNGCTLSNANLTAVGNSGSTVGTMAVSSGKWYYEATVTTLGTAAYIGFADLTWQGTGSSWTYSQTWVYLSSGNKGGNGSSVSYGATYTTGDVIGIALDLDNGTLTFYKNNSTQGTAFNTGLSGVTLVPFVATASPSNTTYDVNFGQRPFTYTPPSGFKALNTFNLPTPTIGATASSQANKYFDIKTYTGTGSSLNITGLGFQPDLVWIKERNGAADHALYDAVRGVQKQLESNNTDAETTETTGLTAFNSDGFTVGALAQVNTNTDTYVSWNWDANGAGSSNTQGSITSTVSANTTAGFSVVTYTFSTSGTNTVGHGLGVAPAFIIMKDRTNAYNWDVYHQSVGYTNRLVLNSTAAAASGFWASTPTSTTFAVTSSMGSNNDAIVAYCFAEVAGYSKFGSLTGNGSTDGPFIYTGFRPKYIMIKRSDSTSNWGLYDSSRSTYNTNSTLLLADTNDAEATYSGSYPIDFLSNGFKVRNTSFPNANGGTYIYACFAENPFKYSLAR